MDATLLAVKNEFLKRDLMQANAGIVTSAICIGFLMFAGNKFAGNKVRKQLNEQTKSNGKLERAVSSKDEFINELQKEITELRRLTNC